MCLVFIATSRNAIFLMDRLDRLQPAQGAGQPFEAIQATVGFPTQ
jgi:hypothetical protein